MKDEDVSHSHGVAGLTEDKVRRPRQMDGWMNKEIDRGIKDGQMDECRDGWKMTKGKDG